jgi:cytoskeletal protein CcmA (bactofilin family)
MWNKRREEEAPRPITPPSPPSPPPVAPVPIEPKKEMKPVSSMPVGRLDPESRGGSASIGKAVKIVGQIFSKEDLYVDGDIEGTVEALEHRLTIGPHGTAKAGIKAREVVLQGTIQGNVEAAEKMEIKKDARLVGDVRTARIMIEDGAYFKGSIDIVKPEPAKAPPKPQPAAPAIPVAPAVPATAGAPAFGPDRR